MTTTSGPQSYLNAREFSKHLIGHRLCADCGNVQPLSEFRTGRFQCKTCSRERRRMYAKAARARGVTKSRYPCKEQCGRDVAAKNTMCLTCYKAMRRAAAVGPIRERVRHQKTASVPKTIKLTHPCEGGCGEMLTESKLCYKCRRVKQNTTAASAERQIKKKRLDKSLEDGTILGVLRGRHETWVMVNNCRMCAKPIADTGLCYTCATGRQRTQKILPTVEYATPS